MVHVFLSCIFFPVSPVHRPGFSRREWHASCGPPLWRWESPHYFTIFHWCDVMWCDVMSCYVLEFNNGITSCDNFIQWKSQIFLPGVSACSSWTQVASMSEHTPVLLAMAGTVLGRVRRLEELCGWVVLLKGRRWNVLNYSWSSKSCLVEYTTCYVMWRDLLL
jgi:hypothetical protein